jgi:hypothetical protein
MKIEEITKKGKEQKKALKQVIIIKVTLADGKIHELKYTLNELIQEFVYLKQGMEATNIFTLAMALEFYKVKPDHKFFQQCDEKFITHLKLNQNKDNDLILLDNIAGAIARMKEMSKEHKQKEENQGESHGLQIQNKTV